MSTETKKTPRSVKAEKSMIKNKPTIFPLGFSVGLVENGPVIVDFVDVLNGVPTIIESIALSREKAEALASAIMEAVENEEAEN
jgi:hypothetical protein